MNFKTSFLALTLAITAGSALAQHAGHAKHGMLLHGAQPLFASHIVYKQPHNYQVILRMTAGTTIARAYAEEKTLVPGEALVFVFDPFDIATLETTRPALTGDLYRENAAGERTKIRSGLAVAPEDYALEFFNELPLSLEQTAHRP